MKKELFSEGGQNRVKNLGNDQYSMSISIPDDEDGRRAMECPNGDCSPGYFKVKPGTGIVGGQDVAYCPYCRHSGPPSEFITKEQLRYAKDIAFREAQKGVEGMIKDAFGLGPSGKRKMGGDFISMEVSFKPSQLSPVRRPFEDEVRRDVVCPYCTLDQTVFGLAIWCADCGQDIFMSHVSAELAVTKLMVDDIERRRESFGRRVAAKDLENCLEDAVSIFEASIKAIVRRAFAGKGEAPEEIERHFKKIGNSFQNVHRTRNQLKKLFDFDLGASVNWDKLSVLFEKRHPITHNLGIIDRKYLERTQVAEREGREIRIVATEIIGLLTDVEAAIKSIHNGLIDSK